MSDAVLDMGDNDYSINDEPTGEHPAGQITLPGRVRSEARILALVGAAYVVGGLGICAVGCYFARSVSVEGTLE